MIAGKGMCHQQLDSTSVFLWVVKMLRIWPLVDSKSPAVLTKYDDPCSSIHWRVKSPFISVSWVKSWVKSPLKLPVGCPHVNPSPNWKSHGKFLGEIPWPLDPDPTWMVFEFTAAKNWPPWLKRVSLQASKSPEAPWPMARFTYENMVIYL